MNKLLLLSIIVGICLTAIQAKPHPPTTPAPLKSTYDNKFDNIDIDEILNQDRLLKNYVKCLEGTGACTPDGKMLKETLPDAIASNCSKCTERQKYGSDKVTHFLIDKHPEDWTRLEKIYDPEGSYRKTYLNNKQQNDKDDEKDANDANAKGEKE